MIRPAWLQGLRRGAIFSGAPAVSGDVNLFPLTDRAADGALMAGLAVNDEGAAVAFVRRFEGRVFGLAVVGESNAIELWTHLTTQPNQKPLLGTVTPMKGRQYGATCDGMSRVYHYEITGGGRVDYRYNKEYRVSGSGDVHQIVQIVLVSLGSH